MNKGVYDVGKITGAWRIKEKEDQVQRCELIRDRNSKL